MGEAALVGCFGKLPCVGDFVQRYLPAEFVNPWDRAFEAAVASARQQLGSHWDACWQGAPPWRFVLAAEVCGPACWAGVLVPSVDRVGRSFPMVLAAPVPAAMQARLVLAGAGWFAALEAALEGETRHVGVEAFGQMLQTLRVPAAWLQEFAVADPAEPAGNVGEEPREWPRNGEDHWLAGLWQAGCVCGMKGLWWTRGHARMTSRARLVAGGLPPAERFNEFLCDGGASAIAQTDGAGVAAMDTGAVVRETAAQADPLADLLGTPLNGAGPDVPYPLPEASTTAVTPAPAASGDAGEAAYVATRSRPDLVWVVADAGEGEGTPAAARQARELLEDLPRPLDIDVLQSGLRCMHPGLQARGEDLLDPVHENAAVVVASVQGRHARLLRVGAACAWHGRRGQWRPLFEERERAGSCPPDGLPVDTLSDMLGGMTPRSPPSGLGAKPDLQCERAECLLEHRDRLVLLATRSLTRVQADTLAWAWEAGVEQEARMRLATAAGLDGDPGLWPLATIEVGE